MTKSEQKSSFFFKQKRKDEAQATARREAIQNGKFSREQKEAGDDREERMKGRKLKRGTPIPSGIQVIN